MRHSYSDHFRQQVSFLRRQFLQTDGLPFTTVLSEVAIASALESIEGFWMDRVFSPLVTLWVFLGQVLSSDHSCRAAVARLIAHRISQGQPACSAKTGAYCQARKRLPEKFFSALACFIGRKLAAEFDGRWLYPITAVVGTLVAANYDFSTFLAGTLTVSSHVGSVYVLSSSANGSVSISGNATINLPGDLVVDSSSASAILASGNSRITALSVQVVGGVCKSGNAVVTKTGTPGATNDPLALPVVDPIALGLINRGAVNISGNSTLTINSGFYTSISASGNAKLILNSGVYYIKGGGFTISGNASIDGSAGVLIYNTIDGSTNGGITLSGNGTFNLKPSYTTGTYAGVIIFQPAANTRAMAVSGNAMLGITGTIYAPSALLSMSGNGQLGNAQNPVSLVVNGLNLSGNISLAQLATGGEGLGDMAGIANTLLAGDLALYVDNSSGYFTTDQLARIQDAVDGLDSLLTPYHVSITLVAEMASANLVLDAGSTSASGSMAQGVLGSFNPAMNEITILVGWNWYAGSDAGGISASQFDFQTTVTHEFGHALGLGHGFDLASPMYEMLPTGTAHRNMSAQDLNVPCPPVGADPLMATGFEARILRYGTYPIKAVALAGVGDGKLFAGMPKEPERNQPVVGGLGAGGDSNTAGNKIGGFISIRRGEERQESSTLNRPARTHVVDLIDWLFEEG